MMATAEDRATVGERYSRAVESSNLKLGERRGDIDIVIAAGLVPDTLASTLFRLQVEYDGVRAGHAAAEERMRLFEIMAKNEAGEDDETGETAEDRAGNIRKQSEREALTAHVLILSSLTSLREAKRLFGEFAILEATRRGFMRTDREALVLAGQVLDVFLNPGCRHCQGRGFNGATRRDEPQMWCRPCRGTGHRRDLIGKDSEQRLFASHLLMATDAMMFQVQQDIRAALRMVSEAKVIIAGTA